MIAHVNRTFHSCPNDLWTCHSPAWLGKRIRVIREMLASFDFIRPRCCANRKTGRLWRTQVTLPERNFQIVLINDFMRGFDIFIHRLPWS